MSNHRQSMPRVISSSIEEKKMSVIEDNTNICDEHETEEQENQESAVTSHLFIKPAHTTGTLDKEAVLRRIRHRKRVDKFKNVIQDFLGSHAATATSSNATGKNEKVLVREKSWIDDAFSAP